MVFVAGQVAEDGERKLVGAGDLAVQAAKPSQTSGKHSLQGARPDQVTKITILSCSTRMTAYQRSKRVGLRGSGITGPRTR